MAKYQKGECGNPSGRPKGSRNKKTEFFTSQVWERCQKADFNPIDKLIEFAQFHPESQIQYGATKELVQLIIPKPKAVKITTQDADSVLLNLNLGNSPAEDRDNESDDNNGN